MIGVAYCDVIHVRRVLHKQPVLLEKEKALICQRHFLAFKHKIS